MESITCLKCGKLNRPTRTVCRCGWSLVGNPGERVRERRVVVTDFDMPFTSMIRFMLKWALASIPAMLVILVVLFLCRGCGRFFHF